ncbi:MAG: hypothetical protein ACREL7_09635 [Longimicrobiales bacterium]
MQRATVAGTTTYFLVFLVPGIITLLCAVEFAANARPEQEMVSP